MFIAFIGMRNAKLVMANSATFVGLGSFADKEVQTACFGLALTLVLMSRRIHGAILLGIPDLPCSACFAVFRAGLRRCFPCPTLLPPSSN